MENNPSLCLDCHVDTGAIHEYYMLKNELWGRVNPALSGMLCLDCVEKRLGRPLFPVDFVDSPINDINVMRSPGLARRYSRFDYALSVEVSEEIRAIPRECYRNAVLAVVLLQDKYPGALYVEGWGNAIFPTEHAWIEWQGKIIDPTWVISFDENQMQDHSYFPVCRYDHKTMSKRIGRRGGVNLPTLIHDKALRFENNAFMRAAYLEAIRERMGEEAAKNLKTVWSKQDGS